MNPYARTCFYGVVLGLIILGAIVGLVTLADQLPCVERQIDWILTSWWFPAQLFILWLVHARFVMSDYGAERLFWEERWHVQFFSLFGTGLVVAASLFAWFLLDEPTGFMKWTDCCPAWFTLFPFADVDIGKSATPGPIVEKADRGLRDCGRFVLIGLVFCLIFLLLTKVVQACRQKPKRRWRFAKSRKYFIPGAFGYLAAILFTILIHALDKCECVRTFMCWVFGLIPVAVVTVAIIFRQRNRNSDVMEHSGALRPTMRLFVIALGLYVLCAYLVALPLRWVGPEKTISQWIQGGSLFKAAFKDVSERRPVTDSNFVLVTSKTPYQPARSYNRDLHAVTIYLDYVTIVLILLLVILSFALRAIDPRWAFNPALLLCLLVILSDLVLGYFALDIRNQAVSLLLVVVFLIFWNRNRFWWRDRYRFPGLEAHYVSPRSLAAYPTSRTPRKLLSDAGVLKKHLDLLAVQKQKLVIVVTSGGGIRSVVWTAHMLEKFDAAFGAGWREQVRLITGASGGMVGAALWRGSLQGSPIVPAHVNANALGRTNPLTVIAATPSLRPVAQTMVLRDLSLGLLVPFSSQCADRGRELEAQWELAAAEYFSDGDNPFRKTFTHLRDDEKAAKYPSLVFCPVAVEDNRRFLISNLDLEQFAAPGTPAYSRSAYQLFKLFPSALRTLTLGTAARMNATFPIVSPLVPLPTEPPRRLMDAGLYDNYGVEFASNWLLAHRETLMKKSAGVVLVELRAFPLTAPGLGPHADDYDMRTGGLGEAAAIITGPLGGLFRGRANITYHRNNAMLAAVAAALPGKFDRAVFELDEEASLSWYLSTQERDAIAAFSGQSIIQRDITRLGTLLGIPPTPAGNVTRGT